MDTWALLLKELKYHGINLIDNKKCQVNEDGEIITQGVIKTYREVCSHAKRHQKILLLLWKELINLLEEQNTSEVIVDNKMESLFIFSLKDLTSFLFCFEDFDKSIYYQKISACLSRDIKSFTKKQIYMVPDYKISIDWIFRKVSKLLYISKLLYFAAKGKKTVEYLQTKTARGVSGPFANLDLPMEERMFPFGEEIKERDRAKQKQRRYQKGLDNYNGSGAVGEGHYWREPRNEPFSWFDRGCEDPYPSRSLLSK